MSICGVSTDLIFMWILFITNRGILGRGSPSYPISLYQTNQTATLRRRSLSLSMWINCPVQIYEHEFVYLRSISVTHMCIVCVVLAWKEVMQYDNEKYFHSEIVKFGVHIPKQHSRRDPFHFGAIWGYWLRLCKTVHNTHESINANTYGTHHHTLIVIVYLRKSEQHCKRHAIRWLSSAIDRFECVWWWCGFFAFACLICYTQPDVGQCTVLLQQINSSTHGSYTAYYLEFRILPSNTHSPVLISCTHLKWLHSNVFLLPHTDHT